MKKKKYITPKITTRQQIENISYNSTLSVAEAVSATLLAVAYSVGKKIVKALAEDRVPSLTPNLEPIR